MNTKSLEIALEALDGIDADGLPEVLLRTSKVSECFCGSRRDIAEELNSAGSKIYTEVQAIVELSDAGLCMEPCVRQWLDEYNGGPIPGLFRWMAERVADVKARILRETADWDYHVTDGIGAYFASPLFQENDEAFVQYVCDIFASYEEMLPRLDGLSELQKEDFELSIRNPAILSCDHFVGLRLWLRENQENTVKISVFGGANRQGEDINDFEDMVCETSADIFNDPKAFRSVFFCAWNEYLGDTEVLRIKQEQNNALAQA